MLTRYGFSVIIWTSALFSFSLVLAAYYPVVFTYALAFVLGVLFFFNFLFFRDPKRTIPEGDQVIISPADGTVVEISECEETTFLKTKARKISIFLSVFNVHVNRMPVSGKIEYLEYRKGAFLAAFNHRASDENEQTVIGINSERGPVLFKQIAGLIARRIIYTCNLNDQVTAGERFGMIRYGSRVDVFLPLNASVNVSLKDKVYGGETILGEFSS